MKLPIVFQRVEGGALLAAFYALYILLGYEPLWFFVLFFSFDVSILGYLVNRRVGAFTYNAVHSFIGPALLLVIGTIAASPLAISFSFIWFAHLGFDRMIGFGLMYTDAFGDSHLGKKTLPAPLDKLINR